MKYDGPERRLEYRRSSDRDVCPYHDMCKERNKESLQEQKDLNKTMWKELDSKLPAWVFKLFLSTFIPLSLLILSWVGYQAFETNKIVVRLDTNQIQLMRVFDIEPKSKPE